MQNPDTTSTYDMDNRSNKSIEDIRIINDLILEYEGEIVKLEQKAKMAFKAMMFCFVLCLIVFVVPNFIGNHLNSMMRGSNYYQDCILRIMDTQKVYSKHFDNIEKRFHDIRGLQNKYGAVALDTTYFNNYDDDKIYSNLLYNNCLGANDTNSKGKKLVFGCEIPPTSDHNRLNSKVEFVKLKPADTTQDRNFENLRNGFLSVHKLFADSLSSLATLRDKDIFENKKSLELVDSMSVRVGAVGILLFMVLILLNMQYYYHQLANFYLSRRNAFKLQLLNNKSFEFENAAKILNPDKIEMKIPRFGSTKTEMQ